MENPNAKSDSREIEMEPDQAVVDRNLEMLNNDMIKLLYTESIGGNAGAVEINNKKYSCAGANGYADPETGEILIFENIQNIRDKKIVEENIAFTLRAAIDLKIGFIKIVDFFISKYNKKRLSDKGKLAIEFAIDKWNKGREHLIP